MRVQCEHFSGNTTVKREPNENLVPDRVIQLSKDVSIVVNACPSCLAKIKMEVANWV